MDLMPFSVITRFKSSNPDSIHSNLESPRQCSLVGKFMIHLGLISCLVTNIFPTLTAFFLHATS